MGEKIGSSPPPSFHILIADGLPETKLTSEQLNVGRPAIPRDQCEDPRAHYPGDELFSQKPAYPIRPGPVGPPPLPEPRNVTPPTATLAKAFGPSDRDKPALLAKIDEALRANKDKTFEALANDKKALALMTPEQKAQAIGRLIQGRTTNREDRAILNYLESCKTRAEFDRVLALAGGGAKVLRELDHKATFRKTLLVYQAWGRDDSIPPKWKNFASQVPNGVLLQPDAGGLDGLGRVTPRLGPQHSRSTQNLGDHEAASFDHHLLREIDPGTRVELIIENAARKSKGQPLLDYAGLLSALGRVTSEPISVKQQKREIEEIRRSFGLSKDNMRELGTGRLASVSRAVKDDITAFVPVLAGQLQSQLAAAVRLGEDSLRVVQIRSQLAELTSEAGQRLQRLDGQAQQLEQLYRVRNRSSFWSKVGKTALKVIDRVAPLLVLIPGFGQAAYAIYTGIQAARAAMKGNLLGALGVAARFAGPLGGAIGGSIGRVVSEGGKLLASGLAVERGVQAVKQGDIVGGLASLGAGFNGAGRTLGLSSKVLDTVDKGVNLGSKIATTVEGIASGDYTRVLEAVGEAGRIAGLKSDILERKLFESVTVRDVLAHGDQGAKLFRDIRNGDFDPAFGILHRNLEGWAPADKVDELVQRGQREVQELIDRGRAVLGKKQLQDLWKRLDAYAPFVLAAANGNYSEGLARLAELEPLANLRDRVIAARTAATQFEPAFQAIAAQVLRDLSAAASRP